MAEGLERTAGIITAAGLIMIVVFGAFAMGNVLVIKELGVGLAMAVLLDSTIIRVVLVPASMKLMGHLNWWMPSFLSWVPEISEGGDEDEEEVMAGHRPARFCGRCGAVLPARARASAVAAAGSSRCWPTTATASRGAGGGWRR